MMQEKINVHIADDHQILIDGIIAVINTDDDIVVVGRFVAVALVVVAAIETFAASAAS